MHQPRHHPVHVLHGWRAADERQILALCLGRNRGFCDLRLAQGAANHGDQFLEIERLRQIFVRAPLGGGDRRHERVLGAHDDDGQFRPDLLDARDQIEGVLVGHDHVGDHHVALALADPVPQRRRVARCPRTVAGARQSLVHDRANCRVIVGYENISAAHVNSLHFYARMFVHWQKHAERRLTRTRFALDDPAMIADDLCDKSKAKPGAFSLRCHERLEEMLLDVLRHAPSIVRDANFQRQPHARIRIGQPEAQARAERRRQRDLPVRLVADGIGAVFDEIEEGLDELVPVSRHSRQAWIVALRDRQMTGKSGARNLPDVVQYRVNIDGLFMNRALISEDLHAVDESADAIGFFGDEVGEGPVFLGRACLQQLRRAPYPRKRIFDFMSQYGRHGGDGTGSAPMRELPLDHGRHAALLHHEQARGPDLPRAAKRRYQRRDEDWLGAPRSTSYSLTAPRVTLTWFARAASGLANDSTECSACFLSNVSLMPKNTSAAKFAKMMRFSPSTTRRMCGRPWTSALKSSAVATSAAFLLVFPRGLIGSSKSALSDDGCGDREAHAASKPAQMLGINARATSF